MQKGGSGDWAANRTRARVTCGEEEESEKWRRM